MRAGVPIRTIVMGAFIMAIFFVAAVTGLGGIAASNHVTLPAGLNTQYNYINGNNVGASVAGGISPLTNATNSNQGVLKSSGFIGGTITAVTIVTALFGSINTAWTGYTTFIGGGLQIIGINPTYSVTIGLTMLIMLIILAVLSAIFLFPV